MAMTLDIAALVGALAWPIVLVVILILYRQAIPDITKGLATRISKLEIAGISIELAVAKPFVPEWSGPPNALDLRHRATSLQVVDSTAATFLSQLTSESTADYAQLNLGAGKEWLTSRLFIMSIVFARMKGIECFVFVEKSGELRKRFVGWAAPERIRWALAKQYPWLEQAYAEAYSTVVSQPGGAVPAVVVSNTGRLAPPGAPHDASAGIALLKEYLARIQSMTSAPTLGASAEEWILIDESSMTYEHARWMNSEDVEQILDNDLNTSRIRSTDLPPKSTSQQARLFLSQPGRFVAVVWDDQRFEYLVDRGVLLEQVAKRQTFDSEEKS